VDFLDLFLLDCLLRESDTIEDDECRLLDRNYQSVVNHGRDPQLELAVTGGSKDLQTLGLNLLDSLVPLAERLDSLAATNVYSQALLAQMHKLRDAAATPSARALEAMRDGNQGHVDWQLAISREHQQSLRSAGLKPEVQASMAAQAERSLQEQAELEAADELPFSEFLARYQMT